MPRAMQRLQTLLQLLLLLLLHYTNRPRPGVRNASADVTDGWPDQNNDACLWLEAICIVAYAGGLLEAVGS